MNHDSQAGSSPVSYPPDPNPKKPRIKLPPGSWDCHFHVFGPPHLFPYAEDRWHTAPAAPVEHYLAVAKILGLERGTAVLPPGHGTDPASVLDAIRKSDGRLRGVIRAYSELDDAEIRRLHALGIRGIRIELRTQATVASVYGIRHDPSSADRMFEGQSFERLIAKVAKVNWPVALHLDPNTLVQMAEVIRRIPVPVIIEGFAGIDARLGTDQPALKTLLDLACERHIWQKNHGAHRMTLRGATYAEILPIVHAVQAKAPDRTIWGTDWPHSGILAPCKMPNDGDLVEKLLEIEPNEAKRHKMLVDNPKRLFDFD